MSEKIPERRKLLGACLRSAMEQDIVSGVELARHLGVTEAAVAYYRYGRQPITERTALKIRQIVPSFRPSVHLLDQEIPKRKKPIPVSGQGRHRIGRNQVKEEVRLKVGAKFQWTDGWKGEKGEVAEVVEDPALGFMTIFYRVRSRGRVFGYYTLDRLKSVTDIGKRVGV